MLLFLICFLAGILTVLAPCVLPLLPVIVGSSLTDGKIDKKKAFTIAVSLSVSVILFTLLLKVSALFIGVPEGVWKIFSGGIILIFGIITCIPSLWENIPFIGYLNRESNKAIGTGYQKKNLLGDIIIGAALGPVFSTCSPTYFVVLATVLPQNFALGIIYLFAYSAGLSLALLGVAVAGQKIIEKLGIAADPRGWFKKILGVIFILVGIAVISGFDKKIEAALLNSGIFDITKIEQKLLEFNAKDQKSEEPSLVPDTTEEIIGEIKEMPADVKKQPNTSLKKVLYPAAHEIVRPAGFVNTGGKPITIGEFKGKKVVLLDIWTYSCINCQRTLPYVHEWYEKYKDQGLEIISLHTPEFSFEKVQKNVEDAVKRFDIRYPVVLDNEYATWNAYGNRYWPRKYLIDLDGYIVYDHIGEGGYEETEQAIQKALAERNERLGMKEEVSDTPIASVPKISFEPSRVSSPEVYFGAARNSYLGNGSKNVSGIQDLKLPSELLSNMLYLEGKWLFDTEYAENQSEAKILFKYEAKNVYMVASSAELLDLEVWQDGIFVKTVSIQGEKLYQLIEGSEYGNHVMELRSKKSGLKAFTFTFG
jgi:cytochrome c biogenesis protein CcdA/thiol-disulfide isomerase/thioredoxin